MTKVELVGTLRREHESDNCFSALGWTPESQRVRQRSKTTWRRTIERREIRLGHGTEIVGQKAR